MIDLHMHTFYSDGSHSPEALVTRAASIGLAVIAITDHDNVNGSVAAQPYAKDAGIDLIPAVEMTTQWNTNDKVDLLGYFVDFSNDGFQAMLKDAMWDLRERIVECCAILTQNGYALTYDEVLARNPRYAGALHVIEALVEKGLADNMKAGVAIFEDAWFNVRPCALHIREAIRTINQANGVAVLAHPTRIQEALLTAHGLQPLVDAGLDGIEVYHPMVGAEARPHYEDMARQFELVVTGGSDEHGYPEGFPFLGKQPITEAMLDALRARARHS
jgi:predicted metal-dependent phosphoesterase TrpH